MSIIFLSLSLLCFGQRGVSSKPIPPGYTLYKLEGGMSPVRLQLNGTVRPPRLMVDGRRQKLIELPGHPGKIRKYGVYIGKKVLRNRGARGRFKKSLTLSPRGELLNIYFIGRRIYKAEVDRRRFFFEAPFYKSKMVKSSSRLPSHWLLRGPVPKGVRGTSLGRPLRISRGVMDILIPLKTGRGTLPLALRFGRKKKKFRVPYRISKVRGRSRKRRKR